MKLVKYKVSQLLEPKGNITHKVIYETITKNEGTGGFGYGIKFMGSYKECLKRKEELENELSIAKIRSSRLSRKKQKNK